MIKNKRYLLICLIGIIAMVILYNGNSKALSWLDTLVDSMEESLEEEEEPIVVPTIIPMPLETNYELNAVQKLFISLTPEMTREAIDNYIEANHLEKYEFSHQSGYYIGFEYAAIRQRGRDRIGEAVDINFSIASRGSDTIEGLVTSAVYAIHTGWDTHYALSYKDGKFYLEGVECESGEAAMQQFLKIQNDME